MNNHKPTVGLLGAGKLGTVLAQLLIKAGYQVNIAGSGEASTIALSMKIIVPGAVAVNATDAISRSDIVVLALPLSKISRLPKELLKNKLVIDAMNYWWEVDGDLPDLQLAASSSEMVQVYLQGARVVKAFSHMGYHNLYDDFRPDGAVDRKAIAIAGDNTADTERVADLVSDAGFDPVIIGSLHTGKLLEPGMPLFGASVTADELRRIALVNQA